MLLDEPTNHLDIESIQWLEDFLKKGNNALLLISHDRLFLDNITNRTIEVVNGKIRDYPLPYTKYKVQREQEIAQQTDAAKNQDKYVQQTEQLINKFRAKKNKAAFAQSLIKKLDRLDKIEIESDEIAGLNILFPPIHWQVPPSLEPIGRGASELSNRCPHHPVGLHRLRLEMRATVKPDIKARHHRDDVALRHNRAQVLKLADDGRQLRVETDLLVCFTQRRVDR